MIRWKYFLGIKRFMFPVLLLALTACASSAPPTSYRDPNMDFAALRAVAVMPFENLTRDRLAADRVRDAFINSLLSTGAIYVVSTGEVSRAISRSSILSPSTPSTEEIAKVGTMVSAGAVITGVIREYGEVRSGSTSANVISLSMQMFDVQSKKIVWSASSTQGGISMKDRLFGSGGHPMNDVTELAINDILNQLFQ